MTMANSWPEGDLTTGWMFFWRKGRRKVERPKLAWLDLAASRASRGIKWQSVGVQRYEGMVWAGNEEAKEEEMASMARETFTWGAPSRYA